MAAPVIIVRLVRGKHAAFPRYHLLRRASCTEICGNFLRCWSTQAGNVKTTEEIIIPKRIKRKPTDILVALAGTVSRDCTAPHYRYHDDPYLIPASNIDKRLFSLSKESGRKTAKFILKQHAQYFQHKVADPPIEALMPQPVYDMDGEINEEMLLDLIDRVLVPGSVEMYEALQKRGVELSSHTKQSLLEMICFYNGKEATESELLEECWYRVVKTGKESIRKTWQENGAAEKLFKSMEPQDSAAYCSLIRGMNKYYHVNGAWKLYQEMQEKGLSLDEKTYNSMIQVAGYLKEGYESKWEFIVELLNHMKGEGVKPSLETMNSILDVLTGIVYFRKAKSYALETLAEFKHLGIEPSLGTFSLLLTIFSRGRGQNSVILYDILDYIEGKEFTIQDPRDMSFFLTAMTVCSDQLHDKELGYRVDELLHTGKNILLIGDNLTEAIYYRNFFKLLCGTEDFEVFMELYNKLTPNVYSPEPAVMESIIQAIEMSGAIHHLPRIWSDIVVFQQCYQQKLLERFLRTMVVNPASAGSTLEQQYFIAAWDLWEKIEQSQHPRANTVSLTGAMLGDIMTVCVRAGKFPQACQVLNKLVTDQEKIGGVPEVEDLQAFFKMCCDLNKSENAISLIKYAVNMGFDEAITFAKELGKKFSLDLSQKTKLMNIFGFDVLDQKESTQQGSEETTACVEK